MRRVKSSVLLLAVVFTIIALCGYTRSSLSFENSELQPKLESKQKQTVNMFVTHGHCSLPFAGSVDNLKVDLTQSWDMGNPLEGMKVSFEIDPNTFNVCARKGLGPDLTERIKTPGLFVNEDNEKMNFISTDVYTMGLDWYQINGILSIKGVDRKVKLFATGIRKSNSNQTATLIIEGRMDLFDWGIDYDLIVNGKSNDAPTKMMHLNMRVDLV